MEMLLTLIAVWVVFLLIVFLDYKSDEEFKKWEEEYKNSKSRYSEMFKDE